MDAFMSVLIKMSLRGVVIILVVLLIRLLLKKLRISHKYILGLWAMAFLYFIFPWKLSLSVGFWNNANIPEEMRAISEFRSVADERYGEAGDTANIVNPSGIADNTMADAPAAIEKGTVGTVAAIPVGSAGQNIAGIKENSPGKLEARSVIELIWLVGLCSLFGHIAAGNGSGKKRVFVAPIGFDEGNVKSRIRNVMKYRYTLPGIGAAVVIVILALSVMFLTEAKGSSVEESLKTEASGEEPGGRNTVEGALLNLSVGVDEMLGLSAGTEAIPSLSEEKTNDSSDMADVTGEIRERSDTTILTIMKEGMPEEIPATLYVGEGYSFYLTDDDWVSYFPNEWIIGPAGHTYASFSIRNYAGLSKDRYEEIMTAKGYVKKTECCGGNCTTIYMGQYSMKQKMMSGNSVSCI